MKNIMGIINLSNEQNLLKELTQVRCPASVPFGGRYRLIDFVLSNMVNSGIQNVAIFALDKFGSLMDHLGSGKEWDLDRKRDGLFIFPPPVITLPEGYGGELQNFYGHLDYFKKSAQEYVIISGSIKVYNCDYREAMGFHLEGRADITVLYREASDQDGIEGGTILEMADKNRVTAMGPWPQGIKAGPLSMETFIMSKALFIELIRTCLENKKYRLVEDGILSHINNLRVLGFPFQGYLAVIDSVKNYFRHSMELLNPMLARELFFRPYPICTKAKNEPPTKYLQSAIVRNSLIANGCFIEGLVENSILFRGVKVARGAVIKNSIVMPRGVIGSHATVENLILEKEVKISAGGIVRGDDYAVIGKRRVI